MPRHCVFNLPPDARGATVVEVRSYVEQTGVRSAVNVFMGLVSVDRLIVMSQCIIQGPLFSWLFQRAMTRTNAI